MFSKMIAEINECPAVKSLIENKDLNEMFVDQNDRSSELNDFINDVKNDLYELQKMAQLTDNMNLRVEDIMKLIQRIGERADMAFEKFKMSDSEDVNESTDLMGASVFGIGGEEKLVNIQTAHDGSISLQTDEEVEKVRSVRKGMKDVPVFFQKGGWYYPTRTGMVNSDRVKGYLDFDKEKRLTKKQAMEMIQKSTAEKPNAVVTK